MEKKIRDTKTFWEDFKEFKRNCIYLNEDDVKEQLDEFICEMKIIYHSDKIKENNEKKMRDEVRQIYRTGKLYANGWFINNQLKLTVRDNENIEDMPKVLWDIAEYIFTNDKIIQKYDSDDEFPEKFDDEVITETARAFSKDKDYVRSIFAVVVENYINKQLKKAGIKTNYAPKIEITDDEMKKILEYFSIRTITSSFYVFVQLNPSIHQLGIDLKKIESVYYEEMDKYIAKMTEQQKTAASLFENNYQIYL